MIKCEYKFPQTSEHVDSTVVLISRNERTRRFDPRFVCRVVLTVFLKLFLIPTLRRARHQFHDEE